MSTLARILGIVLLLPLFSACANITLPDGIPPTAELPTAIAVVSSTPAVIANPTPGSKANNYSPGSIHLIHAMATRRAAHTATLLDNGKVLLTGGFGQGDDSYTNSAELYDPATGMFTLTGRMTVQLCCHTATRLPDGRVLIAGGFNGEYLSNAELYDPVTGQFTPTGSLTTPRMDQVAVLLDNGKVLVAGGVGTSWTFLASAELYDPARGSFSPTGDMSVPRESHTITKLHDGRVLITGGHQGRHAAITIYDSAEIYDPQTGLFTLTGNMNVRRHKHDAVLLADGRVLVTGGSDEHDDQDAYTSSEIYDPETSMFTPAADMPSVRYKHIGTSLLLLDGRALIAGGARNAVIYDPLHDTFSLVPGDLGTAGLSRLFSTATLLRDGGVLIAGGYEVGQDVSAGAWVYNP